MIGKLYFTVYYVIKNLRVKLIPGNMIGVSKAIDALFYLSLLQVLNVKFLLKHVMYTDARHCQACNDFTRRGILVVASVFILLCNMIIFRNEGENPVPLKNHKSANVYVACYAALSVILFFV